MVALALGAVLVGGGVCAVRRGWPVPSHPVASNLDPRLTIATPYRNVRPDVSYVGDAACAECHAGHAENYHQSPMGRSMVPVSNTEPLERYDAAAGTSSGWLSTAVNASSTVTGGSFT